jgi:hypothetical protein
MSDQVDIASVNAILSGEFTPTKKKEQTHYQQLWNIVVTSNSRENAYHLLSK